MAEAHANLWGPLSKNMNESEGRERVRPAQSLWRLPPILTLSTEALRNYLYYYFPPRQIPGLRVEAKGQEDVERLEQMRHRPRCLGFRGLVAAMLTGSHLLHHLSRWTQALPLTVILRSLPHYGHHPSTRPRGSGRAPSSQHRAYNRWHGDKEPPPSPVSALTCLSTSPTLGKWSCTRVFSPIRWE